MAAAAVIAAPVHAQSAIPVSRVTPEPEEQDTVVVTGVLQGTDGGILGDRSPLDLPFNQSSYDAELLKNQQVRTLADVVLNDPSVRQTEAQGSTVDYYQIRGFLVQQADLAFNGSFGLFEGARPGVEGLERVEILKGPSALIFGFPPRGSIGGTVNQIPKRAGDTPINQATLSYFSESQVGAHLDVGRRFGANKAFGLRVNGACRDGDTAVDKLNIAFCMASAAFDYRGDRLTASVDLGWSYQDIRGYSLVYLPTRGLAVPRAPDASRSGSQDWLYGRDNQWFGVARAEYALSDALSVYGVYGRSRVAERFRTVYPAVITSDAGDFTATVNQLPSLLTAWTGELGVRARFATGPVQHRLSASAYNQKRKGYYDYVTLGSFQSNIYRPVDVPELRGLDLTALYSGSARATSAAVVDTLSVGNERLQVILGARQQWLEDVAVDIYSQQRTGGYEADKLSPMLGVVLRPSSPVSVYANYVEGLQAGFQVGAPAENAGQVIPPLTSKQYEAGAKYQAGGAELGLALFQLERPSSVNLPGSTSGGYIVSVNGLQRHRGVELYGSVRPVANLQLLGGATYIDARQTRTEGGLNDGRRAVGVPELQVNLYAEYALPFLPGLTATGRYLHTSNARVFADVDDTIPGWDRFDIGARYAFTAGDRTFTARLTAENVFDRNYYQSADGSQLFIAAPRVIAASLSAAF